MDNTDNDGQNSQVAELKTEAAANGSSPEAEQKEPGKLPAPALGFDESGEYFFVKIHVKYGVTFIRGFLKDADDWIKAYVMKQRIEMEKRKLVKPEGKFLGRFNLFK